MKAQALSIPDVVLFTPTMFGDDRGLFMESYNARAFADATGCEPDFVQDNHSNSQRGVLRGLHYQLPPNAQGKLVRVVSGAVFDVAVDLRRSSPTFGQWVGQVLSAVNRQQLWIPPGFAHGFLTLTDTVDFLYKTTAYYAPASERAIAWNDPAIGIEWPARGEPLLSEKDLRGMAFADAEVFA
jgi:dTDP-4-dehydrorhamnose 3,5-epimerase